MYETLIRPHKVSHIPHLQPITQVSQLLKQAEKKREEKRLRQIANNSNNTKRKRDTESIDPSLSSDELPESKRIRLDDGADLTIPIPPSPPSSSRLSVSNALPEVRGHTSYLTFAVLVPFSAPSQLLEA